MQDSWQQLLKQIIKDPRERERIAREIGITQVTLYRWASGHAKPHSRNLHALLQSIPPLYREEFAQAITIAFPDYSEDPGEVKGEIPAEFYFRVFRTVAGLPEALHFWSICDMLLHQALDQLDPQRQGMAIIIAQCMPPTPVGTIRSLREAIGRGTPPWSRELEQKATLIGAESLAGHAVSNGRLMAQQDLSQTSFLPVRQTTWEKSAAACPITRNGKVAGALIVSSTQIDYFTSQRLTLVQSYADLLMLVFEQNRFYDLAQIQLGVMPKDSTQQTVLKNFQERVSRLLIQSANTAEPITMGQAERLAWQQVEEELLHLLPNFT
jgi:hypothetical protein